MKKFAIAAAALGALAFTVPALAQDVKVKIGEGHHHMRGHEVRIHHDRGRHEGWRRHGHRSKVVIIKRHGGHHGMHEGRTVIKKKTVIR
jgi:hypothetical protein